MASLAKSRKIPARRMLPLFFAIRKDALDAYLQARYGSARQVTTRARVCVLACDDDGVLTMACADEDPRVLTMALAAAAVPADTHTPTAAHTPRHRNT